MAMKRFLTVEWAASLFAAAWAGLIETLLFNVTVQESHWTDPEWVRATGWFAANFGAALFATRLATWKWLIRPGEIALGQSMLSAIIFSIFVAAAPSLFLLGDTDFRDHAPYYFGDVAEAALFSAVVGIPIALMFSVPSAIAGAVIFGALGRLWALIPCHCSPMEAKP